MEFTAGARLDPLADIAILGSLVLPELSQVKLETNESSDLCAAQDRIDGGELDSESLTFAQLVRSLPEEIRQSYDSEDAEGPSELVTQNRRALILTLVARHVLKDPLARDWAMPR